MIYQNRVEPDPEKRAKKMQGETFSPEDIDPKILATIDYEYPYRRVNIEMETGEFTSICPFSGLPDFACISISYIPDKKLIEMKSLKYYLYAYRNVKAYNEHVVNKILEDLSGALCPRELEVRGVFTVRGGMKNTVTARFVKGGDDACE